MDLNNSKFVQRVSSIAYKISDHNLFLLSSSISYYSALALAPFIVILLVCASLLGQNIQQQIMHHAELNFSPKMAEMIQMIFQNVNTQLDIASVTGIIGLIIILWTCSLVFLQFRYSLDIIYGHHDPARQRPILEIIQERLFSMMVVLAGAVLLIASFAFVAIVEYLFKGVGVKLMAFRSLAVILSFFTYVAIFAGLHYFTPTQRQKFKDSLRIAFLSSIFFMSGNVVLAFYLRTIAAGSVYGAAGTLLVFLIWSYYSTFTILLSVELYLYLKRKGLVG